MQGTARMLSNFPDKLVKENKGIANIESTYGTNAEVSNLLFVFSY